MVRLPEPHPFTHCSRCSHGPTVLVLGLCPFCAAQELAEWRSGRRRVFWRVKWRGRGYGNYSQDWGHRNEARGHAEGSTCGSVYRVTVGPAKKKEAG